MFGLQVFAHAIGDYLLQSDWMATVKTRRHPLERLSTFGPFAALVHATTYSIPFILFFRPSLPAYLVIVLTHYLIDHYRLARYLVWAKNFLAPRCTMEVVKAGSGSTVAHWQDTLWWRSWEDCKDSFGAPPERPAFLAMWLMIIVDNLTHIALNYSALRWL
jgi:hypothetical protein